MDKASKHMQGQITNNKSTKYYVMCIISVNELTVTFLRSSGSFQVYCQLISSCVRKYFDGLLQERRNSIANALELRFSCINPQVC